MNGRGHAPSRAETESIQGSHAIDRVGMTTSIPVSKEIRARLKGLKERMKPKTFDELLRRLLERSRHSPRDRLGAHPEMKRFSHRDDPQEP